MQLTENFWLSEFTNSNQAKRLGIDNTPEKEHIDNLMLLCQNVLEPVRKFYNRPVIISSGFRCQTLNSAVGGSKTSQHTEGKAADIEIPGVDNCELASWIRDNLTFDQLILEFHDHFKGPNDGWTHVSFNHAVNRNKILTAKRINGKTFYFDGLIQ